MDKIKGYKTVIFNIFMAIVMVVRVTNPDAELPDEASIGAAVDAMLVGLTAVWGVGNIILRAVTNSSIFNKE